MKLDNQFRIKKMTVRNRLVLPPLTTNYGTKSGCISPEILDFYKARSSHMGIVIVEAAAISPEGRIVPGSLGLWDDTHIQGLTELADAIKAKGARAIIQINHAGAKAWVSKTPTDGISPSGIACRPGITPVSATPEDIKDLIRNFTQAAIRAQKAGFDGVEIHGAHFYLLSQFLSPLTNRRTDNYGGSVKKRASLAVEIVRATRERLGNDYPIFFRLNVFENMDGGIGPDESVAIGKMLAEAGVDVLDLSIAVQGTWKTDGDSRTLMTTSAYAQNQAIGGVTKLAARFGQECGLPVIVVGRLGSGDAIEQALKAGADMVAIGRQMICDPDTVTKILSNKEELILECEACMACFGSLGAGKPLKCKVNKKLPG